MGTKKKTTTTKKKKKQKKKESESEQDDEDEYGSVLNGHLFVLSGSNQNARKKKIKDNGGNTKPSMSKQVDFLVVENKNADFNNSKCKKAKELNIPIVTDQFIADCIKKDKFLSHKAYIVGDEDDEESEDEDMDKNKNNDDDKEEEDDDISMKDNDVPTTPKKAKKGNVFANKAFVISGSNQKAKKEKITKNAGKVQTKISGNTNFVIVQSKNSKLTDSKCRSAKKAKIPILSMRFIDDCIEKQTFLDYDEDDEESEDEDMDKNKNNDDDLSKK